MKRSIVLLAALLSASPALCAQSVTQSGNVTPNHVSIWATNGVIKDGGTASNPLATSFGVVGGQICVNSGPTTGAYNALCFAATPTGGTVSIYNYAGATGGLSFVVNGVTQGFPTIPVPTTTNDAVCFGNTSGQLVDCSPSGIWKGTAIGLGYGGLGGSQSAATVGQVPVFPGSGGAAVPGSVSDIAGIITLAQGGLGASQASAAANSVPVFPGSGGAASPTTLSSIFGSPPAIGGTAAAAGKFTTLQATGNLTTNVTGSTQCLHANSSGVVSGTSTDCNPVAGSDTQIQFNNSGAFGASANFTWNGSATTITIDSITSSILQDASSSQDKLTMGAASSVNLNGLAAAPGAQIKFTPNASHSNNTFDIQAVNALLQLDGNGGAIDPQILLADVSYAVIPYPGGNHKGGIGFLGRARAGAGAPVEFNFGVNDALSGSPAGNEQSVAINIYSVATLGDQQNGVFFFSGTGTNSLGGTMTATTAGHRLGEIGVTGSLPDGNFTQTESGSINWYADTTFSGTTIDGSYTALTNEVHRLAVAASSAESIVGGWYSPGTLAVGAWADHGNSFTGGPGTITIKDGGSASSLSGATIITAASGQLHLYSSVVGSGAYVLTQSGAITGGHHACWNANGILVDCGS